jgi:hypothetical protein
VNVHACVLKVQRSQLYHKSTRTHTLYLHPLLLAPYLGVVIPLFVRSSAATCVPSSNWPDTPSIQQHSQPQLLERHLRGIATDDEVEEAFAHLLFPKGDADGGTVGV